MPERENKTYVTFEHGLHEGVEASVLINGQAAELENWVAEGYGGLRVRRQWKSGSLIGGLTEGRGMKVTSRANYWETPTIVQTSTTGTGIGQSPAASWNSPTTAGNLLVAILTGDVAQPVNTPAGWTSAATLSAVNPTLTIFYIENAASQSGTQTFALGWNSGATRWSLTLMEISGIAVSGALDKTVTSGSQVTATPVSGTTAVTSQPNDFAIAAFASTPTGAIDTYASGPTNNYTERRRTTWSDGGQRNLMIATKRLPHAEDTTTGYSFTLAGSADVWMGALVTFKAKVKTTPTTTREVFVLLREDADSAVLLMQDLATIDTGVWTFLHTITGMTNTDTPCAFAYGLGRLLYTSQFMGAGYVWDGTAFTALTGVPFSTGGCRTLAFHKSRFFAGGFLANPTRLYWSALNSPSDWTTVGNAGHVEVGQNDGEPIEDIVPFQDGLLIAKSTSLWFLSGSGPDTFSLERLNGGGAHQGRSICITPYGALIADSRYVWFWDGNAPEIISEPVSASFSLGSSNYVSTAYCDGEILINESTTGNQWVFNVERATWRRESISDDPATKGAWFVDSHDYQLLYTPNSTTLVSPISYRDSPGGERLRDEIVSQYFKVKTPILTVEDANEAATPHWLYIQVNQRDGVSTHAPLYVTPFYGDGYNPVVQHSQAVVVPRDSAGNYRYRIDDIGSDRFGIYTMQFLIEQTCTTDDEAVMDIEKVLIVWEREMAR